MSHASFKNIGAYIKPLGGFGAQALAGGTGDATESNGAIVDRMKTDGTLYQSATFVLFATATLAASKKATFKATIQHDTDSAGGTMADVGATLQPEGAADSVVLTLTDGGAGSTLNGTYGHDINLESLNRYIRGQVHIDLNAANTDIGSYGAGFILGGAGGTPI